MIAKFYLHTTTTKDKESETFFKKELFNSVLQCHIWIGMNTLFNKIKVSYYSVMELCFPIDVVMLLLRPNSKELHTKLSHYYVSIYS